MDQSISCQDIYCIYKHPLSILIHQKFQDKDGCSKNGSRQFVSENFFYHDPYKSRITLDQYLHEFVCDSRGVLLILRSVGRKVSFSYEAQSLMLHFHQFSCKIESFIPIVQEERGILRDLVSFSQNTSMTNLNSSLIEEWFDEPFKRFEFFLCCYGHLLGHSSDYLINKIHFNSTNCLNVLKLFDQLHYFTVLKCAIGSISKDNMEFEENFGRILGSKLVHLEIICMHPTNISQFENCLTQFTKLKILKLDINRQNFNPSFLIEDYIVP